VVAPQEQKIRVLVVDDDPDFVEAAKVSLAVDRTGALRLWAVPPAARRR